MKHILFLFTFLISIQSYAQIVGNVKDTNGNPLAFVNIYIEGTYIGTTSNDDGHYEFNASEQKPITIVFKYLGYKTLKKEINDYSFPMTLNVALEEEKITLDEVVIDSGDNPANRIMRLVIANRKQNLEKNDAFKANFYSRGLIKIKDAPEKILGRELGDLGGGLDSTRSGIIYLSETISKIEYQRPDKLKEYIIASKISGNDNGFSFNTASDVDYNFYNNTIELGNQIVSPIADFAFNYYRYKLEGVFYDDHGNLINKIAVIPKRENDRIFSGTIYIVEDQWSIYALELNITGQQAQIPAADTILLKQSFSYSEVESFWVLISQSIDFEYGIFGIKGDGRFTAVYSAYDFNPNFTKKTFTREVLSFADEANKKDSTYWNSIRPVPLTNEESTDYIKKDSIQIVRKSQTYLDSIDAKHNKFKLPNILFGYDYDNSFKERNFSVGSPISNLNFNTVQGYNSNLNIGFRKNFDEFRRYFSFNTVLNYGFGDMRFRPMASVTYKFNNISRPFVTLSGGVMVQQFNASNPISPLINSVSSLFFEDNYMKLYEKSFTKAAYSHEWFNGFRFYTSLSYENRKPLFNTTDQVFLNQDHAYTSNNPLDETAYGISPFDAHDILKLNITTRLRFGQDYYSYPDSKFNVSNDKYPSLYVAYEKGFGASIADYNFDQLSTRLEQGFNVGNKGYLQYNLKAGTFFNADAIAFMDYNHFNGNQTRIGQTGSYTNVFNNLPYYVLSTNNSYFEFHAEHDFKGFILGKIPLLNALNYNLVIGMHNLSTKNYAPYQEYSIGIDNMGWGKFRFLRLDYVRSYQNGFKSDALIFGLKFLNFVD